VTRALALLVLLAFGCGGQQGDLPACDTLREVRFVALCADGRARCALLSTAPASAVPDGCALTVVGTAGPRQVECADDCGASP